MDDKRYEEAYENGAQSELASIQALLEEGYGVPDGLSVTDGIASLAARTTALSDEVWRIVMSSGIDVPGGVVHEIARLLGREDEIL